MKILDIAIKDMLRSFRSVFAVVFMFVVPLLVTGMFYLMFGRLSDQGGFDLGVTQVVVANLDEGSELLRASLQGSPTDSPVETLGQVVVNILQREEMSALISVIQVSEAASARAAVDEQQAQVALIIPPDFSAQFADLEEEAVLEFYQDPTFTLGPMVVGSILEQVIDGFSGAKIVIRVLMDQGFPESEIDSTLVGQVVQAYMGSSGAGVDPAALTTLRQPEKESNGGLLMQIVGPIMGGMMIFYAFYTGTVTAQSILKEDEEGTLPRLFTTPTSQATILGGKFLAVFMMVGVQVTVLLFAARLVFNIYWGTAAAVALTAAGTILSAASFGIFVVSWIKHSRQGGLIYGGVLTMTGMLGMMKIFTMTGAGAPPTLERASLFVPQGWAVRSLLQSMNGDPLLSILTSMTALLGWSLVFFVIGVWRFQKRYA